MSRNGIPSNFVFTKMQTDAGEDIRTIRNRKELERIAGECVFWWGVGESKGRAIEALRRLEARPKVLFSLMYSQPDTLSREPGEVFLWQAFRTPLGEGRPLPRHVIVTSGAATKGGTPKARYHALVCASRSSILRNGGGGVDAGKLINIGDSGRPVGSSQITAVVRHAPETATSSRRYEIAARADLAQPFFADLTRPRKLSVAERRLLLDVSRDGKTVEDWLGVAGRLRRL